MVMINLMQTALQLSILHSTPNILASGSLLSHVQSLNPEFEEALKLNLSELPLKRSVVMLNQYEGYLGCLGVMSSLLFEE